MEEKELFLEAVKKSNFICKQTTRGIEVFFQSMTMPGCGSTSSTFRGPSASFCGRATKPLATRCGALTWQTMPPERTGRTKTAPVLALIGMTSAARRPRWVLCVKRLPKVMRMEMVCRKHNWMCWALKANKKIFIARGSFCHWVKGMRSLNCKSKLWIYFIIYNHGLSNTIKKAPSFLEAAHMPMLIAVLASFLWKKVSFAKKKAFFFIWSQNFPERSSVQ